MAGYEDTRKKIIETLMGRPIGEEIQPENHQDYALNMLDYVRSLELIANGPLIGVATPTTQPVQPNDARACYLAGVAQDRTVTFQNFRNYLGQPIQITNGQMEACLVILIWDTQYWSAETVPTSIISQADQANFYYNLVVRKTYPSVAAMNADIASPIGTDGKYIKVGDIVTVVNSTTPSENGFYSYEGSENGWLLQSGFSFEIVQTTGTDINKTMSQNAVSSIVGLNKYKTFSTASAYSKGQVVNYNGLLYKFVVNHTEGAWNDGEVEEYSLKEDVDENIDILSNDYIMSELNKYLFDLGINPSVTTFNGATTTGDRAFTIPTGENGRDSYIAYFLSGDIWNFAKEAQQHGCKMRVIMKCFINEPSEILVYANINKSVSGVYSNVTLINRRMNIEGNSFYADLIAEIPTDAPLIQPYIQVHGGSPAVEKEVTVQMVAIAFMFVDGEAEIYNRKLQESIFISHLNENLESGQFSYTNNVVNALNNYLSINENEPFGFFSASLHYDSKVSVNTTTRTITIPANSGALSSATHLITQNTYDAIIRGINDYKLPVLYAFKVKTNGNINNCKIILNAYYTDKSSKTGQSTAYFDAGDGLYYFYGVHSFDTEGKNVRLIELALERNTAANNMSEGEIITIDSYSISLSNGFQGQALNREVANKLLQVNANKGHGHIHILPDSIVCSTQGNVVKIFNNSLKIPANEPAGGSYFQIDFGNVIETFNKYGIDKFQLMYEIEMPEDIRASLFVRVNGTNANQRVLYNELFEDSIRRAVINARFNNNGNLTSIIAYAQFYETSTSDVTITLKNIRMLPLTDEPQQAWGMQLFKEEEEEESIDNRIINLPGEFYTSYMRYNRFFSFRAGGDTYGLVIPFYLYWGVNGGILPLGKTLCLKYNVKEEKNADIDLIQFAKYNFYRVDGSTVRIFPNISLDSSDDSYNYYTVQFNIDVTEVLSQFSGSVEISLMSNVHTTIASNWNLEITNVVVGIPQSAKEQFIDLRNKLQDIDNTISDINNKIGLPYYTNNEDALLSITALPQTGSVIRSDGKGITIPAGISELDNELRVRLQYGKYVDIPNSSIDLRLGFNGDGSNTFDAKVYTLDGILIGSASWYWDSNNGMIRVNFPISAYKWLYYVEIRIKCTSAESNGFDLFYTNTLIEGQNVLLPIKERLAALESSNAPLVVTSNSGKKFRITVDDNGTLSTSNYYFSKVLILSHSFGKHTPSLSIGWNGNWGMAASEESEDFSHKLIELMKTANPDVSLTGIISLQPFEVGHTNEDFNYSQFDYINEMDFDCVVIKIGENTSSTENYGEHIIKLLSEHIIKNKQCKVFIASSWYTSSDTQDNLTGKDAEFGKVATYYGTKVIMINDSSRPNTAWDYPLPNLPNGQQPDKGTYPNGWSTSDVTADNGRVIAAVVGGHPGNYGHTVISNAFWNRIKLEYGIVDSY